MNVSGKFVQDCIFSNFLGGKSNFGKNLGRLLCYVRPSKIKNMFHVRFFQKEEEAGHFYFLFSIFQDGWFPAILSASFKGYVRYNSLTAYLLTATLWWRTPTPLWTGNSFAEALLHSACAHALTCWYRFRSLVCPRSGLVLLLYIC